MPRYIDADALVKRLKHSPLFLGTNMQFKDGVIDLVERQPTTDVVPKSEVKRLEQENETLKDNNEHLAVMLEEAKSEVERLRNILLQFTDIVHKWGSKNNIDTSEISLVPILQEEADSIIKNANQEYAMEIFSEIEKWLPIIDYPIIAELKNKYTESEDEHGKRADR